MSGGRLSGWMDGWVLKPFLGLLTEIKNIWLKQKYASSRPGRLVCGIAAEAEALTCPVVLSVAGGLFL